NQLDGTVSVLIGNGDGTFQAAKTYNGGQFPVAIAIADWNGDGHPDLAVANQYGGGGGSLLYGNGDGTFQAPVNIAAGVAPRGVVTGDFNGDGVPDLAVTQQDTSSGSINVLLGNGNGTFKPPVTYTAGTAPGFLLAADLNGDGRPDLIA